MKHKNMTQVAWVLGVVIVALYGVGAYFYYQTTATLADARAELQVATTTNEALTARAEASEAENAKLSDALEAERGRNDAFEERIETLAGTVGRLDKLAQLDPELLQKYSKVYFLNENYAPTRVSEIDAEFRFNEEKVEELHADVLPFLNDLLTDAKDDDIDLLVASSYRSFTRQGSLKSAYTVRYGSGANAFSAEQGYSEHQLGTAIDLTTREVGGSFVGFDRSEAYEWLVDNAYKYGFILSYPKGNTYYVYEPWHWRFVGVKLAEDLHDKETNFYDLDQREIDAYLVDIFE